MKKVISISIITLSVFLISCLQESFMGSVKEEGMVNITFTVNIPDANGMIKTRAWTETDLNENKNLLIENMFILIFDEAGFISRHQAQQGNDPGAFTVQIPSTAEKRIIHFICNYNKWDDFSDEKMQNCNEATVIANMYVENKTVAYWNRMEISQINSNTSLSLTLIRNAAKISVINTTSKSDESSLENVTFAIGNYYDRGTVAAFNTSSGKFDGEMVYEAKGASLCGINSDDDFTLAYKSADFNDDGVSQLTYERYNSDQKREDHLYIIIKGDYYNNYNQFKGEKYYKIDIVESDSEILYDIYRNRHYILTINQVLSEGYDTIDEAINSLALNNIATSVMQSYNSISDGTDILNLEYVNKLFVKTGNSESSETDFAIRYSYIDGVTGATDNRGVEYEWGTEFDVPSIAVVNQLPNMKYPGSSDLPEGYADRVSGKLVSYVPENGIAESYIKIAKNNLSRKIILRLRKPFNFDNIQLIPISAERKVGEPVTLSFNVPENLELPFLVYIYAPMLAPQTDGKVYFEDRGTSFRYRYTVNQTGNHILYFQTGSTHGEGEIRLESDLFESESMTFYRND